MRVKDFFVERYTKLQTHTHTSFSSSHFHNRCAIPKKKFNKKSN